MRQTLYGLALLLATATASCPSESDASLVAWGDAAAWDSGSVPSIAGANVTVTSGKHVLLSAAEAPASAPLVLGYVEVEAGAKLVFATHADSGIEVHVRGIIVHGLLQAGTEECPISTSVVIELYSDEKLALSARSSPQPVERKGIHILGAGVAQMHGSSVGAAWTRLASPHAAGETTLLVRGGAETWAAGATIVVATTHFRDHSQYSENEVRVLTGVVPATASNAECAADAAASGRDVALCASTALTIDAPLEHAHYAHETAGGYAAEVLLLSRTLVVRGDSQSEYAPPEWPEGEDVCVVFHMNAPCQDERLDGDGGHIFAEGSSASLHMSNVELYRMGQTNVRGRYPVHFHLMGDADGRASVRSCAVWHSFFRCYVVHGTHGAIVDGNAAYDAVGHCYYLEDGIEENNIISGNAAVHVHFLISPETATPNATQWRTDRQNLGFPVGIWTAFGQFQPTFRQIPNVLDQPADLTAGGFYISNLANVVVDNAASGGWAGFTIPTLTKPLGLHRHVDVAPNGRPPLLFARNSAHSSGFWWGDAGCIYAGGKAFEEEVGEGNDTHFVSMYSPGRNIHDGLTPRGGADGKSGAKGFAELTNLTVAMSLNHGLQLWSGRSHVSGLRALDTSLGLSVLGIHHLTDIIIECRSSNKPHKWADLRPWQQERKFWTEGMYMYGNFYEGGQHEGFSWYDQGQRHIVDGMEFRGCANATGLFVIFSGGDRAHTQVQMASRKVRYRASATSALMPPPENMAWWMQKACDWDPNRTTVHYQWLQQNWIDLDGSTSGRGVPTLMASAFAGYWWRLDAGCERRWDLWLCDLVRARWPAALQLRWQLGLHHGDGYGYTRCGGSVWGCVPLTPCPQLGYATHIGFPPGRETHQWARRAPGDYDGMPITPGGALTGPAGGFGWFIHLFEGAPRELNVSNIQLPSNSTHLVLALQYPPGTNFEVSSRGAVWCNNKYRTWSDNALISTCAYAHRAVSSAAQVRVGRGDEYFFDGTHLFIRALPTSTYFDFSDRETAPYVLSWENDVLRSELERTFPYTWTESGVSLITPACGTVESYDDAARAALAAQLAVAAGVPVADVELRITSASVNIEALIRVASAASGVAVVSTLGGPLADSASASALLGIAVESAPTLVTILEREVVPAPSRPPPPSDASSSSSGLGSSVAPAAVGGGLLALLAAGIFFAWCRRRQRDRRACAPKLTKTEKSSSTTRV